MDFNSLPRDIFGRIFIPMFYVVSNENEYKNSFTCERQKCAALVCKTWREQLDNLNYDVVYIDHSFSVSVIQKYRNQLNFNILTYYWIKWSKEFIEKFIDKADWNHLTVLFVDCYDYYGENFIEKYLSNINWTVVRQMDKITHRSRVNTFKKKYNAYMHTSSTMCDCQLCSSVG